MMPTIKVIRCQQAQSGLADVGLHPQHGSGASIRREPPPKMKRLPWRVLHFKQAESLTMTA
jgi:hypothetical protein